MTNTTTPATPDGLARCMLPPTGWACSRTRGHEGPCAARPLVEELARGMLRDELRRTNSGRDFAATWEGESEAWLLNADYAVKFLSTPLADNGLERVRTEFLPAILHGDETHRAWLREAVDCFLAGKPVPPPTGNGTPSQANDAAGQGEVDTRVLAEAAMAKARDEYHELYSAELRRLRALLPYVYHKPGCRMRKAMGQSCVCGLERALSTSQGEG